MKIIIINKKLKEHVKSELDETLSRQTMLFCDVFMIVEHGASVESFNCTFLKPLW